MLKMFFYSLLEELLQYTEKLSKLREKDDDQKSAKFASSMLNKSQKLIGALYSLLPFESFVNVIHGLIEKENHLIRKKSLELLSSKLENIKSIPEDQVIILILKWMLTSQRNNFESEISF